MGHLLALLFGFFCSVCPGTTVAHHDDPFVVPVEYRSASYEVPVRNRESLARHGGWNSYSEDACLSCRSTNSTSQPQLILRAQR